MKKGFMLEEDAGDHFLLRHSDGHVLRVAKKGISPQVQKVIESFACGGKMPGYYGGGGVEAFREKAAEDNIAPAAPKEAKEKMPRIPQTQIGTTPRPQEIFQPMAEGGMIGRDPGIAMPETAPVATAPITPEPKYKDFLASRAVPQAVQQPQGILTQQPSMLGNNIMGDLQHADRQMQQGQRAEASAIAKQGEAQAQVLSQQEVQYRDLMQRTQDNLSAIQAKMDSINQSILNQEIDPMRAWNSRSTGSKILGIFGMLLSGVGAGMAKQENMAIKLLNKQIDDDIKSQEADLGKKRTVLDAYMKEYGNVRDAAQALRLDYMAMAEAQLKKIAAQSAGPIAQAKADQFSANWALQKSQIMTELASKMATQQQQQINIPGFSLVGGYRPSDTEAKDTKEMYGAYLSAAKTIDQLTGLIEKHGTEQLPTQAKKDMQMLVASLKLDTKKASQLGNLSASDYELLDSMIPDPTASPLNVAATINPFSGPQMKNTLEKFKESLANKLENAAVSRGYAPNAPLYAPKIKTTTQYKPVGAR